MARVAVTISLSDDERAELEALSRRRKTSQGLARRARIVLAAAEGLENKEIAVRLEASADTVGKWRRRYAAEGLDGLYDEPRPGAPRQIGDDAIAEAVRLTLEETPPDATHWKPSLDGAGERPRALDHSSHLAGLRLAAASLGDLQAVERSLLRGEGPRHRRSVFGAAGSCPGSLCRRKEPDPGPGPFPAPLADAPRAGGAAQPRLQAPRHDLSLRGPRHRHGRDHRQMFPAPSGPRVPQIPRPRRGRTSLLISTSTSSWTTTGPTRPRRSANWFAKRPRWQAHFHTHQRLLAEPGRALVRAADRQADQARRPSLHQGVGAHHPRLHRHDKPEPQTLQMDQIRR